MDKVVAITGGARGIGAAIAHALIQDGARVAIGDVDLETASKTAADLGAVAFALDVTSEESFMAFLDQVEKELGPIDVLVNNAGIMPLSRVLDEDPAVTKRVFDINVHGMITGTRQAARRMAPRGHGHIVNVASTAGKAGLAGGATYCASKAAIIMFSEAAEAELRDSGIAVSVVLPGIVNTELSAGMDEVKGFRHVSADEVAQGVVGVLRKPRFDVYVPAVGRQLLYSTRLLPRRAQQYLGRKLKADRAFLDALDAPSRRDYEDRARG